MSIWRSLRMGLKALHRKGARNDEIEEELRSYIEDAASEKMQRGMSHEEAVRQARAEVGSMETVKHRVWSAGWESKAELLWSDLVYTLRRLMRAPGLVFAVVLSIGLGVAANSTIFSLVSKYVLAPAPVGDPQTLTMIYRTYDNGTCCNALPMPVYRDLRDQSNSFSGVSAYYELVSASIAGAPEPERVWGQATSANYFDVAQLHMAEGRGFASDEEASHVVVLGYDLWRRHFNSDPLIVGKAVRLSGLMFTVVGVAPRAFRGIDLILDPEYWVPLGTLSQLTATAPSPESRTTQWLRVAARLKPGVTQAQAAAEMQLLGRRFAALHPDTEKGDGFRLWRAGTVGPRDQKTLQMFLVALLAVVLLVLCIACANVTNLLLAQGVQRQREMAVRLALGASRTQLLRQMLLESILLALGGGLAGALLSMWATHALSSFKLPVPIPLNLTVGVDWRVLFYTFGLSVMAGFMCGVLPAWIASRPKMPNALKGEDALARPHRRWSLRNLLVVAQITLSLVLLCAAGLFLRSLQSAARIDIGFRSRGVLMMAVDPPEKAYTASRTIQFLSQVRERLLVLPGVISATSTDGVPLSMGHRSDGFEAIGLPKPKQDAQSVELYMAGPQYFQTLGIPLLRGRSIAEENPTGPKVAVVNEEFVRELFGGADPLGQRVRSGDTVYQVVGVAKDTKVRTIGEAPRPVLFRSINQAIERDPSMIGYHFIVRYEGDPAALTAAVRAEIHARDSSLAIFDTQTMEEHVRDALFLPRLVSTLFGVFGLTGLILASVGLYSVMSYTVSQRTKEIGIRMAVGAQAGTVQMLFVLKGMSLAIVSIALGLPLALAALRLSTSILYSVRPYDLETFTLVPVLLLAVALLACWIPSRRAARVDPMIALRVD